jgi:sugar transferase (PEP-CTERM/EpsH1 system associated)
MTAEILFLAQRIPYPPNRGDKMRSWNILRHLGRLGTVHLAAFADDRADANHLDALRDAMEGKLGEAHIEPVGGNRFAWAARALARREPIGFAAFHSAPMHKFVDRILARPTVQAAYAFSSQMAQFVPPGCRQRFIMDFVDLDSAKYAEYASSGRMCRRLIFEREATKLLACEKAISARADIALFVSDAEVELFRSRGAPPDADIRTLSNGIDLEFYDPAARLAPLDPPPAWPLIVFTGQMNYRPNVEGVIGFANTVLPRIHAVCPQARFAIVGRQPVPEVARLAGREKIIVTGEVDDVRPWLAGAVAVVAPLAIAQGVQNKVLEAMAMARPVVASPDAFLGIDAQPGRDLLVADGAEAQADAVLSLLADDDRGRVIGRAARRRMEAGYSWDARLSPLESILGLREGRVAA